MRFRFYSCYVLSALALIAATGHMIYGTDKVLGIFLVIVAVILARVLVLNIAERLHDRLAAADKDAADADGSPPADAQDS